MAEAPAPARNPIALDPNVHKSHLRNLVQGVRDRLTLDFLGWNFRGPTDSQRSALRRELEPSTSNWQPVYQHRPLASGGMGLVHMWVCTDANQHIIDKVIVKECISGEEHFELPNQWVGDVVGGMPREFHMANEIYDELSESDAGAEKHVTECLGWGDVRNGGPRLWGYKLYFEYCEHLNLHKFIMRQIRGHSRTRANVTTHSHWIPFPEGFLWYLFESLVRVAVGMEKQNILHGDMQASNILFAAPDFKRFKIWPVPKMADFGSARRLGTAQKRRVDANYEAIFLADGAPEMIYDQDDEEWEVPDVELSAKTNIYQIGVLMTCAMRLDHPLPEMEWRGVPPAEWREADTANHVNFKLPGQRRIRRFQHANASYSPELENLVRLCVSFSSANRPSPESLLAMIRRDMVGRVGGMERRAAKRVPWNSPMRLMGMKRAKWVTGSSFDPNNPTR